MSSSWDEALGGLEDRLIEALRELPERVELEESRIPPEEPPSEVPPVEDLFQDPYSLQGSGASYGGYSMFESLTQPSYFPPEEVFDIPEEAEDEGSVSSETDEKDTTDRVSEIFKEIFEASE